MARAKVELPPDNGARIAIYDGMCEIAGSPRAKQRVIPADQLFEQVIGRLRILVPRELHLSGERRYFDEKLSVCVEADIARRRGDGLTLGDHVPLIQYLDGKPRPYTAGLQAARARVERDDAALRRAGFDVRKLVPTPRPRTPSPTPRRGGGGRGAGGCGFGGGGLRGRPAGGKGRDACPPNP